jgi:hypothetical protein
LESISKIGHTPEEKYGEYKLLLPDPTDDGKLNDGTGVWGRTNGGVGVHGESVGKQGQSGKGGVHAGVFGESDGGRGGVFQSKQQAQLQLVPRDVSGGRQRQLDQLADTPISTAYPLLPKEGRAGDVIVTRDERGDVRLWFCVREFSGRKPAGWAPVLLGETFDA